MRARRRRKRQIVGRILGMSYLLAIALYFCAYGVLHVRFSDGSGKAEVEYWFWAEELPDQSFWRSLFLVAHGFDCALRPDTWNAQLDE